jgi:hypothetical protein
LLTLQEGASRDDAIALLGPPLPEAEWPNWTPAVEPECPSQLIYRNEYLRGYARALDHLKKCGGTWLRVCFDERGRYEPVFRFMQMEC